MFKTIVKTVIDDAREESNMKILTKEKNNDLKSVFDKLCLCLMILPSLTLLVGILLGWVIFG